MVVYYAAIRPTIHNIYRIIQMYLHRTTLRRLLGLKHGNIAIQDGTPINEVGLMMARHARV